MRAQGRSGQDLAVVPATVTRVVQDHHVVGEELRRDRLFFLTDLIYIDLSGANSLSGRADGVRKPRFRRGCRGDLESAKAGEGRNSPSTADSLQAVRLGQFDPKL